jgi:hypothetical protein
MQEAVGAVGRFVSAMIDAREPVAEPFTSETLYGKYQDFHAASGPVGARPLDFETFTRALATILEPVRSMRPAAPLPPRI